MLPQDLENRAKNKGSSLILVVDDDPDILELITLILTSEQFQIITAVDIPSALAQIQQAIPDLILLDLMLSETSGLELLKQIRSNPLAKVRQIPVILLSALVEKPNFKNEATLGTTEFIAKPFQANKLFERVTALVTTKSQNTLAATNLGTPMQNLRMDLPEVLSLVSEHRAGVLARAIAALEGASVSQLQTVSHKIAGALSLYAFVEEGDQARIFSKWLATNLDSENAEALKRQSELLDLLKSVKL